MKLALLSDLHANLRAWKACLAHATEQGADRIAVLGDLVGYGAEPGAVVDEVMALVATGAIAIGGNHDEMAVAPAARAETFGNSGAAWTHEQLSPGQLAFLADLPLLARVQDAVLVHASADEPGLWRYADSAAVAEASLDAATQDKDVHYVFSGHVHQQQLWYRGAGRSLIAFGPSPGVPIPVPRHRQWLVTVGSVGQPRDGRTQAMYAMFDSDHARLTFHRVSYDHMAAAAAIRATGLPAIYADWLEQGH